MINIFFKTILRYLDISSLRKKFSSILSDKHWKSVLALSVSQDFRECKLTTTMRNLGYSSKADLASWLHHQQRALPLPSKHWVFSLPNSPSCSAPLHGDKEALDCGAPTTCVQHDIQPKFMWPVISATASADARVQQPSTKSGSSV